MEASPKILADGDDRVVILRVGVHNDEIKKDIPENINGDTFFL